MLRERRDSLGGDIGARRCAVDDKEKGLSSPSRQVDRRGDSTQIMWAWPRRNDNEIRDFKYLLDRSRECWRRVDNRDGGAVPTQLREPSGEVVQPRRRKRKHILVALVLVLARIPPLAE